ncbi:hypothetical protein GCM10007103_11790 [Salinimicrobium marinum]|uniref:Uncharacterized protein n=1 Tax=Salinimicrobium marinum TaxID=680283 RepID=A0A918SAU7_9FLAO|nr:hypothetical protein GCM10007103_11790 [Salinimicrobium marinum]
MNGDNLKQKIESVFTQSTLSMGGKFTSQNEFIAFDKWSVMSWYVSNFKRKSAYLKGKIIESDKGTLVKLNFKPNTMLSVFPILSVLIGIITMIIAESTQFLIIGSIFILVGIFYYSMGIFSRNRLQNIFEKSIDVQIVSGELKVQ